MCRQGYGYSKSWVRKRMTLSQVTLTCSGRSLAAYRSIVEAEVTPLAAIFFMDRRNASQDSSPVKRLKAGASMAWVSCDEREVGGDEGDIYEIGGDDDEMR